MSGTTGIRWIDGYWGKARPGDKGGPDWHPLAWHCLDVAAAMAALLDARPAWTAAVARCGNLSADEARRRLILVAALHDLGKFAENFQNKVPDLQRALQPDAANLRSTRGHGEVGAAIWEQWGDPEATALGDWAIAAFAHHGVPVKQDEFVCNEASPAAIADALAFARAVVALIGAPTTQRVKGGQWLVAGLVILADWIGSNQKWFPYAAPGGTLTDYWTWTQARARAAVTDAHLAEANAATAFDLTMLLGQDAVPSPLQTWAEAQAPAGGRHLYVIEDLTGAGKTEAALILAHRLMRAGAAEGLYWALPTKATADGLYDRIEHCYRALFAAGDDPSLVLSHGSANLRDGFRASIGRERDTFYGDDADAQNISAEATCAVFIAEERKKTFLAQVGVGTLDQALLGVLPVRHQSLRLAALARRVLILDEAHSYNPHTSQLMERLLAFHAAHGGSAIVLSATLTHKQRSNLIAAYSKAAASQVQSAAFPLASHAAGDALTETPLAALRGTRRDLPFRRFDTPEAAMDALVERARAGYCAVYVRNTVTDAVAAYEALRAMAPEGVHVDLFHARFAAGDRNQHQTAALTCFGRNSTPAKRRGRILVATQVFQESLDLDTDFLCTDLCPMDLLIQRAGRQHRHGHRPPRPAPELWLVAPPADDDVAADWYARLFPKGQYVYPDSGQLWRTLRVLTDARGLPLASGSPRDLIESVFGEAAIAHPAALDDASNRASSKRSVKAAIAKLNVLKIPNFDADGGAWGSDTRTPTRLGEETCIIRLARWQDGVLAPWWTDPDPDMAWRLSEVRLPVHWPIELLAPDAAATQAIEALQAGWPGRYEPPLVLALTPSPDDAETWIGHWRDKNGKTVPARYTTLKGLQHD